MEVKGNINDKVWVKVYVQATIKGINVTGEGTSYKVQILDCVNLRDYNESEVRFSMKEIEAEEEIEEKAKKKKEELTRVKAIANESPKEPVSEEPATVRRKAGRPKKTDVKDLMKKAEELKKNG